MTNVDPAGSGVSSGGVVAYVIDIAPTTTPYSKIVASFGSSGNNTAIAGVANQTIRVFGMSLTFASPVDVLLKDGSTTVASFTNALSIPFMVGANPLWVTTAGNDFVVNLSSAVNCRGVIWYTQG